MKWYVFRYNINRRSIEKYNVFDHGGFAKDVQEALKEADKGMFAEKLKRSLQYYFWARCEHEVVISAWPPLHNDVQRKVDVYEQVMLNWDMFVDYVWSKHENY